MTPTADDPARSLRIGLLTTYLAIGDNVDSGIGQHYRILADALTAAGHQVHVVFAPATRPEEAQAGLETLAPPWSYEVLQVPTIGRLGRSLARNWPAQLLLQQWRTARAATKAVLAAWHVHRIAILETHTYNAPAFDLLRKRSRPVVVSRVSTTRGQMTGMSTVHSRIFPWLGRLERAATRTSDHLVTHSIRHRDHVCAIDGWAPDRFEIIAHGIPDPGEPAQRARDEPVQFLFVGRFEHRKGIDVLLNAIPPVAAACPDATFTLAGDHGDPAAWRHLIADWPASLRGRVSLPGRVSPEALSRLYERCTIFVAPSRYESFGLIYLEAMSRAKPVIGCLAGGIPEVVSEGTTGTLATPGDASSLTAAMLMLAKDPSLRERLGLAARLDFLARFSATKMAEASIELYQRALRTHR